MAKLVRGFRDIFEPQAKNFTQLENCAREVFSLYGFSELRLPTVEQKELFVKSTGETTDIVQKEMYAFEDAGHRQLAIRPEGTPGVVRAYLENNFVQQAPVQKFYYIGNMFRAERPQAGRYREFEQIGAEYIGNSAPAADAEVILMLKDIVAKFGAKNYTVKINSLGCDKCRPVYRQALIDFLSKEKDTLCENCQTRLEKNPLRVLDCKIDGPRFQGRVPTMQLCPECQAHFDEVQRLLKGKINFVVDPMLVRGLDYYSRTVFEFQAGDAICYRHARTVRCAVNKRTQLCFEFGNFALQFFNDRCVRAVCNRFLRSDDFCIESGKLCLSRLCKSRSEQCFVGVRQPFPNFS